MPPTRTARHAAVVADGPAIGVIPDAALNTLNCDSNDIFDTATDRPVVAPKPDQCHSDGATGRRKSLRRAEVATHALQFASAGAPRIRHTASRMGTMEKHEQVGPEVEIFSGPNCWYCVRAKALLAEQLLGYREVDVTTGNGRDEMQRRLPYARSIPQIFICGEHVGGYDDLARLVAAGALPASRTARPQRGPAAVSTSARDAAEGPFTPKSD